MAELWEDAIVVWDHCPRSWLQCADVIVSVQESIPAALLWAGDTLVRCPGCTVAVAFHPVGQWAVAALRSPYRG